VLNRPHRGLSAAILIVLLGALVVACGGDEGDGGSTSGDTAAATAAATERTGSGGSVTASATATGTSAGAGSADGGVQERVLRSGLPRAVIYSDAEWTVTAARVSNESPQTVLDPGPAKAGTESFAYLAVTVRNRLNSQDQGFPVAAFNLKVPGSTALVPAARPAGWPSSHQVRAGQASDITLAFPVSAQAALEQADLVLGEPGFVAATLSLSGTVPQHPYPVSFPVSGPAADVTSANPCGTPMRIELLKGETDLDAGIDLPGLAGAISGPRRAEQGQRFVRFALRASGISGQCGGANVTSAIFRLEISGTPRGAYNVVNEVVSNGEAVDVVLGYRTPADVRDVVLIVGAPDKTTVRYAVTLP